MDVKGVTVERLLRIVDARGTVQRVFRGDSKEVYLSTLRHGVAKGWKRHKKEWCRITCPVGRVRIELVGEGGTCDEITIGVENYCLVTIPPGVWTRYTNVGAGEAITINCSTGVHDDKELDRAPVNTPVGELCESS